MKNQFYIYVFIYLIINQINSYAQTGSPKSLISDVDLTSCACTAFPGADAYFKTNAQVQAAINFARRAEEVQFNLTSGALGSITLPNNYSTMSDSQKGLFLINNERIARAGINYGSGAVLGLPLQDTDKNLTDLAQAHTQNMQTNNYFNHSNTAAGEPDAYVRINNKFGTQKEFNTRAENIYVSCGGYNTQIVEQAIFSWLYQDASSAWGHRAAIFIQNTDPITNGNGYDDNFGPTGSEGFLGIGVLRDVAFPVVCGAPRLSAEFFTKNNQNPNLLGNIVTMMVLDPSTIFMAVPLPVNFIMFDVKKEANKIKLVWNTASEINNYGFNIEKSNEGDNFQKIGFVKGNETSNEISTYSFIDENPENGMQYYRLKQIDFDGKNTFSPIKSIKYENEEITSVNLFPNPAQDFVNINGLEIGDNVEVFDLKGKSISKLSNFNIQAINLRLSLNGISNGLYIVQIAKNKQQIYKKILVNN